MTCHVNSQSSAAFECVAFECVTPNFLFIEELNLHECVLFVIIRSASHVENICYRYRIYPKYWDTLSTYSGPEISESPLWLLVNASKIVG